MSPSVYTLGGFVKERREAAGMTQKQLADLVSIAEDTLRAIENSRRPVSESVIKPLLLALGVEASFVEVLMSAYKGRLMPASETPTPHEIAALEVIHAPAAYQGVQDYRIMWVNSTARRVLRGLDPGTNAIVWLVTDPRAREVFPDWHNLAHRFVFGVKALVLSTMSPVVQEHILQSCSAIPEWEKFWNTEPEQTGPIYTVTVADPDTGKHRELAMSASAVHFPAADGGNGGSAPWRDEHRPKFPVTGQEWAAARRRRTAPDPLTCAYGTSPCIGRTFSWRLGSSRA